MRIANRATATASVPLNVSLTVASKCAASVLIDFFIGVGNPGVRMTVFAFDVFAASVIVTTVCQLLIIAPIQNVLFDERFLEAALCSCSCQYSLLDT